jgi:hypothetical protein
MNIKYLQAKVFGECPDCHAPLNWRGGCTGLINLYKRWDKEDRYAMSAYKKLKAAIRVGQETINKLRIENAILCDRIKELESRPTRRVLDVCPACFGDCERLHNDGLMHKCEVCGGTGKRQ